MKIANTQKGPRGVNTVAGPVLVDPGQTVEVEVYERERQHIEAAGWFDVEGDYTPDTDKPASARNEDGDTPEMEAMRKRFDSSYGEVTKRLEAAEQIAVEKDAEIAELRKQLEAAKAGNSTAPLKAEHHGGGKFNVTQGEAVILSGLSKVDADAFNAMSDEDKVAYVEASKKP